jgi:hypothetical protein
MERLGKAWGWAVGIGVLLFLAGFVVAHIRSTCAGGCYFATPTQAIGGLMATVAALLIVGGTVVVIAIALVAKVVAR